MYVSEISKCRHLVLKYCYREDGQPGCGIDLASQGDPICTWSWSLDLPHEQFAHYNSNHPPRGAIQLRADCFHHAPAEPNSLDFVSASHILEDAPQSDWARIMTLWTSVLKPGGYLIILVPEVQRWAAALARGQSPNCAHSAPEPSVGDMSRVAKEIGLEIIEERMADVDPDDYTILFVGRKALQ